MLSSTGFFIGDMVRSCARWLENSDPAPPSGQRRISTVAQGRRPNAVPGTSATERVCVARSVGGAV